MDEIRKHLEKTIQEKIEDSEWDFISAKLIRKEFSKNSIVLKCGQIENFLSFVESGILRYYIPRPENDLTLSFVSEGFWASAFDSFLSRTPSVYEAQALQKITLWQLSYANLQEIYRSTMVGNRIGRMVVESLWEKEFKRKFSLLNDTPEVRYLKMFNEQESFLRRMPVKLIASYIGITPQALSRIRKRILNPIDSAQ